MLLGEQHFCESAGIAREAHPSGFYHLTGPVRSDEELHDLVTAADSVTGRTRLIGTHATA
jgi:hypothetical protein